MRASAHEARAEPEHDCRGLRLHRPAPGRAARVLGQRGDDDDDLDPLEQHPLEGNEAPGPVGSPGAEGHVVELFLVSSNSASDEARLRRPARRSVPLRNHSMPNSNSRAPTTTRSVSSDTEPRSTGPRMARKPRADDNGGGRARSARSDQRRVRRPPARSPALPAARRRPPRRPRERRARTSYR